MKLKRTNHRKMYVLGIESTAHTFGVGIIRASPKRCTICANIRRQYHTEKGGIIPVKLAEHHLDVLEDSLN